MEIYGGTINLLEKGLNYSSAKGKAISQNIANVDTPNYKTKNVNFKEVFSNENSKVLEAYKTDSKHLDFTHSTPSKTFDISNFRYRQDRNGVDMDKQQADLAANQIYNSALIERLNGKFNSLQSVIKGGR
ncbi:flagellar basal body rod protein FlgB [Sporosarcina sp. P18a]|uniref:flagellar basal body rod protein FlgB n=1 Tax=unclassified Sporosarcina TaxID=2647733 RepID=UPI000C167661|nr:MULTISPECIES: flagellar basal body rod protein FlgB [unclassified Sporosarcina]PIC81404.1 flagellar basal body rod protein FlgB [Sporosarcina sp. P18a]PID16491.1 flagellar basal body rod protein FlgB [Sporosarcina sp. P34]